MWKIPITCNIPSVTVQPCNAYDLGFAVGQKFSGMIKSRFDRDPYMIPELIPFAKSEKGQELVNALIATNRMHYPRYWEELRGMADGSGVPFFEVTAKLEVGKADQCSDVLLCSSNNAFLAHNEDADVSVKNHTYLVQATLQSGLTFIAYTYAGDLPSCAFGLNDAGVGFTLNAVPLAPEEVVPGGIGRNFISRDLLEAATMDDGLTRIKQCGLAGGHNYNLFDIKIRKIVTVETASKSRFSQQEISSTPFFHANMYRHLQVPQVIHQSSVHRAKIASQLPVSTEAESLALLSDSTDIEFPVFMQGPQLYTLCTVLFDVDTKLVTIYRGKPQEKQVDLVLRMILRGSLH